MKKERYKLGGQLQRSVDPRWRYVQQLPTDMILRFRCKIQADGRKLLDRFKSYFGSQISSQSLNEVQICRLQPKSATKGVFFSLIFFVFDCQFESVGACCPLTFDLVSQQQRERFLCADFGKTIVLTTQRSQIAIFSVHFPWFLIVVACLTRPLS